MGDSKKRYAYICQPSKKFDEDRYDEAVKRIEDEGYIVYQPDEHFKSFKDLMSGSGVETISLPQFILGLSTLLMSGCQAAFFPKDWEEDPILKDLYLIAFKYGMILIMER